MTKCDLGSSRFILISQQRENQSLIDQLPEEISVEGKQVTASVLGEYAGMQGEYMLIVDEFKNVQPGSCHLEDALVR
ncbi:hypothetical protein [Halomonas huangheensis]|uniref:Uncharacterized protein n=1 Tax=Halomonas huangheensis TaxID=1178482 RepID=W1NAQ8_9GAMM|nr:hypothetical protein [Halomonas huangheensis]ALM52432.1 hypothetical protein AR456_09165 [Halomonas huangheensis]ERL52647.1 hypothetical protein BJB45_18890 [Halomonas huangheensis]